MTVGPALWTRRATDVQALYLGDLSDLRCGELWLRGHGQPAATTHPARMGAASRSPPAGASRARGR